MKRIALASAALIALTGAAYTQETPPFSYSPRMMQPHTYDRYDDGDRYDGRRYYYRDYDRPRYRQRDYYAGYYDPYYRPYRYHRRYYRPHTGFSMTFGGPGWGIGYYDYWR